VQVDVEHRLASAFVFRSVAIHETAISMIEPQGYDFQ
jgi:hypothetical protein